MHLLRVTGAMLGLAVLQLLPGCGSQSPSMIPDPGANLSGNWNLFGSLHEDPQMSLALIVDGTQIYAHGIAGATCPSGSGFGGGGSAAFSGEIASDGTFTLNQLGANNSFLWTISGTAPPAGSSSWSGTYTLTTTNYASCSFSQTGSFTAEEFTPLNGTYAATLPSLNGATSTGSVTVSVQVSQGVGIFNPPSEPSYIPLTGTITVSGSPCVANGTTVSNLGADVVDGAQVAMTFGMNDGSRVIMSGFLDGTDSASIDMAFVQVLGGQCNQNGYGGTLTRQ